MPIPACRKNSNMKSSAKLRKSRIVSPASLRWIRYHFDERHRGFAIGIYMMGTKIGPAIGIPVAAWRAFGNEPFWSVRVEGETLVFSTPENQAGTVLQARRVPSLVGVVMLGEAGGREFNLTISPGECNDGMSDNRYGHTATWIYGDTTYRGCAEQAKAK